MNQSESQYSPGESEGPVITVRTRPQPKIREKTKSEVSAKTPDRDHHEKGRTCVYTPASLWSHLKYGLGTLAVLVIPPMIPGVTGRGLIVGYVGTLVTIYTIVCIWGIVRDLRSPVAHMGVRRSKHNP
jgi:hypothetical protein